MPSTPFFADMHTHSSNSHDAKSPLSEMCEKNIAYGCPVFAVTDHFDDIDCQSRDCITPIRNSSDDVDRCREIYADRVEILKGIEIGEYVYSPKESMEMSELFDFDVIISSQHFFCRNGKYIPHSTYNFSIISEKEIYDIFDEYFNDIFRMICDTRFSFDILAHLTYPSRYINGKFARTENVHRFDDMIAEILKTAIKRDIALEVNTSNLKTAYPFLMPDRKILEMYKSFGGKLLTVGSDAHNADGICCGFAETFETLKNIGFGELYYFKKRMPSGYKIPTL